MGYYLDVTDAELEREFQQVSREALQVFRRMRELDRKLIRIIDSRSDAAVATALGTTAAKIAHYKDVAAALADLDGIANNTAAVETLPYNYKRDLRIFS